MFEWFLTSIEVIVQCYQEKISRKFFCKTSDDNKENWVLIISSLLVPKANNKIIVK